LAAGGGRVHRVRRLRACVLALLSGSCHVLERHLRGHDLPVNLGTLQQSCVRPDAADAPFRRAPNDAVRRASPSRCAETRRKPWRLRFPQERRRSRASVGSRARRNCRRRLDLRTPDDARAIAPLIRPPRVHAPANGVEPVCDKARDELSAGQIRPVGARASVRRPEIYIFDTVSPRSTSRPRPGCGRRSCGKPADRHGAQSCSAHRLGDAREPHRWCSTKGASPASGTHAGLLETCEVYREIVASQVLLEGGLA